MEWAVWTASKDSEDAVTQEMNEEDGSPSKREQQGSLYGAGVQSSTKDAHGSVDLTFVKEAASPRNGRDSMDPVKAEAGNKPSDKGSQDLIHFEQKQGIKRSAPDNMGSICTVNVSEGDGIPDREPENIAMQRLSEEEDEEQAIVTQEDLGEDLGESAEELEYDSSISMNGVSQKLNLGRSETQRKKRNLTDDGPEHASKLVKRLQHPQENQMPCASTECGESTSDPSCSQWNESLQSKHLEENWAAEEPVNCTESKEMLSHSSALVAHQKVHTGEGKYHSAEGNIICGYEELLNRHLLMEHRKLYKCLDCNKRFVTEDSISEHRRVVHPKEKRFQCTECNLTFISLLLLNEHRLKAPNTKKPFKCPECNKRFVTAVGMSDHRLGVHDEKPFQCTECNVRFNSALLRDRHCHKAHGTKETFKCPDCNTQFFNAKILKQHRLIIHNVMPCPRCKTEFISLGTYVAHTHGCTGVQYVQCTECNIILKNKSQLSQHQFQVHNIKIQFGCSDYTEVFSVDEPFD